jgi:iron complex outermembrane receptor protein
VGVKSQWFDRKLTINLTGYKTTFDGYQTSSSGTDGSGAPVLRSAGKLYTKGIEGDIVLRPTPRLRLSGNFLFSKNEFGDLFISATTNIKGGKPLNAPEAKWGLTGSYDLPVGSWDMNVSSNYTWTGRTCSPTWPMPTIRTRPGGVLRLGWPTPRSPSLRPKASTSSGSM